MNHTRTHNHNNHIFYFLNLHTQILRAFLKKKKRERKASWLIPFFLENKTKRKKIMICEKKRRKKKRMVKIRLQQKKRKFLKFFMFSKPPEFSGDGVATIHGPRSRCFSFPHQKLFGLKVHPPHGKLLKKKKQFFFVSL